MFFTVHYTSTDLGGVEVDAQLAIVDTLNNVYKLKVGSVPINVMTRVNVSISNENLIPVRQFFNQSDYSVLNVYALHERIYCQILNGVSCIF